MAGWRAADQETVASRQAVAAGFGAALEAIRDMAADGETPAIMACWQDTAYLDVPRGVVTQLAELGHLTLACTGRPRLPAGVQHVELDPDDTQLQREWSIVAMTPHRAVCLIATEVNASLPAGTVEAGRAFRFDATTDERIVIAHGRRLVRSLGARLTPEAAAELRTTITSLTAALDTDQLPAADAHDWEQTIIDAVETADTMRRDGTLDPNNRGGLSGLAHWLSDAGPRSPELGMIVVRADVRGATAVLREHAAAVGRLSDTIVDVPPDAAMIVLPGLHGEALQQRADEICALLCEKLATGDVRSCAVEVPAAQARRDLVGSLGQALAQLRTPATSPAVG